MTKKTWTIIACVVMGSAGGLALVGLDIEDFSVANDSAYGRYVVFMLVGGAVGNILLGKALGKKSTRAYVELLIVILAGSSYFSLPAAFVAFVDLASRRSTTLSVAAVGALIPAFYIDVLFNPASTDEIGDWFPLVALIVFSVPGLIIGFYRGQELARAEARLAFIRREERAAIARDVHDSLSHRLSLIAVYAGILADSDKNAEIIRAEAAAAVDELREVLGTLRNSKDPRLKIEDLIESTEQSVEIIGDVNQCEKLSTMRQHTVHHAVREGLNNARKHAPSERVFLYVNADQHHLTVKMRNRYTCRTDVGTGYGLLGTKERAELCGGQLKVHDDKREGEFEWEMILPL